MPELIKLLLRNAAIGFGIAAIFVTLLLLSDTGGVGTLVANSDMGVLAVFMLTFFTGLTFGSVQMGFAVMTAHKQDDGRGRGKRLPRIRWARTAPVRSDERG
ncbi:MAG: hypothetical protein WBP94_08330 [Rhodomicrobiaceae bacterium]